MGAECTLASGCLPCAAPFVVALLPDQIGCNIHTVAMHVAAVVARQPLLLGVLAALARNCALNLGAGRHNKAVKEGGGTGELGLAGKQAERIQKVTLASAQAPAHTAPNGMRVKRLQRSGSCKTNVQRTATVRKGRGLDMG